MLLWTNTTEYLRRASFKPQANSDAAAAAALIAFCPDIQIFSQSACLLTLAQRRRRETVVETIY